MDNTFNLPQSYALDLCHQLVERRLDLAWRCILYPQHVSEELADAMAKAGWRGGQPRLRERLPASAAGHEQAVPARRGAGDFQRLAAHGIRRMGFLLLGGPGETKESVDESLAFARSLDLEMLKVSVGIRLYPYTPLARQAIEEGVVAPDDDLLVPRFYIRPGLEEYIKQVQGKM